VSKVGRYRSKRITLRKKSGKQTEMILAKNIRKSFGELEVLKGVDLSVP
jgi:hypothetical protein